MAVVLRASVWLIASIAFSMFVAAVSAGCTDKPTVEDAGGPIEVLPPEDGGVDTGAPQKRMGRASSLRSCVNIDDVDTQSLECVACPTKDEICFTQVVCGPLADGGAACFERPGNGDGRCHRQCRRDEDCGDGESCFRESFTACTDYNGGVEGRGLCCATGGCQ